MKALLPVGLGVSLLVNLMLLATSGRQTVDQVAPGVREVGTRIYEVDAVGSTPPAAGEVSAPGQQLADVWRTLSGATDLEALRDGLREAGFPELVVRALVGRRIDDLLEARWIERFGPARVEPYWETVDFREERDRREFEREWRREERRMYREVLDSWPGPVSVEIHHEAADRFAFLPEGKAQALMRIETDYSDLMLGVREVDFDGVRLPEDREKQELIEREKRADIAALLSPEELEMYDLHTSRTATVLRNRLAGFDASEAEFRAIHALQKAYDDRFQPAAGPAFGRDLRTDSRERAAAQAALEEQIRHALGDERFLEYQRATDRGFQTAVRVVDHFKLPRENAARVHALGVEYSRRRDEVMRSPAAERAAALAALSAEAGAEVDALLTPEGARAFREAGGTWLRTLEQQASRGAPQRP